MSQITRLLTLLTVCGALAGYCFSTYLVHFKPLIPPILGIIMFSMGLTLSIADCRAAATQWQPLVIGVGLQFLLMPLIALLLSYLFRFPPELIAGMILVGTAPGGTSSNVLAYLAGGKVALSIGMTTVSTLLSVVMMPVLCSVYLKTVIPVDPSALLSSLATIVLLPVAGGIAFNLLAPKLVLRLNPHLPYVAVVGISCAIALVVALNVNALSGRLPVLLAMAALAHNGLGLLSGYLAARLLKMDVATARTVAIEVGTQNAGLAAALAIKHFSAMAALPAALFSVIQVLSGSAVASVWSNNKKPLDRSIANRKMTDD